MAGAVCTMTCLSGSSSAAQTVSIWSRSVIAPTGQTAAQVTAAQVAAQIADLKGQLAALDVTIPRALEDLYTATGQTPYPTVAAVIAQKAELRAQIKALS